MIDAIGTTRRGKPATIDSSPPLTRAIRIKDYERALSLIQKRIGLDEKLPLSVGSTPLELAALHGRLDLVRALWEAGGYPPDAAEYALIRAEELGRTDIAAFLKDKGVRVGSTSKVYQAVLDTNKANVYRLLLDAPHANFSINARKAKIRFYQYGSFLPNAVVLGDPILVKDALAMGAGTEETRSQDDYINLTSLWLAAAYGRTEIARMLIDAGAKVNSTDKDFKYSPLMLACMSGNRTLAELLIRKGANIEAKSASSYTAGFELYGSYAKRTIANLKQRTPLMFAAEGGHPGLVRLLLEAGADPNVKNDDGWTALDAARTNLDAETSRILLEAGATENPLISAICAGDAARVRELLPRLADFLGTKKSPVYPLTLAVRWNSQHGSRNVIDALLDVRDRLSPNDLEAAMRNAKKSDEALLLYLASKGISVTTEGYASAWEVLKTHIARKDAPAFKLLWEREQASLPKKSLERMLKESVIAGSLGIVEFLLEKGGDPGAYTYWELYDLLGYAAVAGSEDIASALLKHGALVNPHLANKLLVNGPILSPLMAAARGGSAALVRSFLDRGAEVSAVGFEGRTALYYAAAEGHPEIIRMLIEAKADANFRMEVLIPGSGGYYEAKGETALMAAARAGHASAVKALLQIGADPRLTDWIGDDALVMAVENGHMDCAVLLREALRG